MNFDIRGKHKNPVVVREYVIACLKHLKLDRLSSKVLIIKFVTSLEDEILGNCIGDTKFSIVTIAKESDGTKLMFLEQMQTLAHELIHAKQFFRADLTHGKMGQFRWKKRNAGGYQYDNQPWEKEAYRLEKQVFVECFPFNRDIN